MLILKPSYRLQVPHGLAIVGALLLLASTVIGVGSAFKAPQIETTAATASLVTDNDVDARESVPDAADTVPQAPLQQKKRFRTNLFLFRR